MNYVKTINVDTGLSNQIYAKTALENIGFTFVGSWYSDYYYNYKNITVTLVWNVNGSTVYVGGNPTAGASYYKDGNIAHRKTGIISYILLKNGIYVSGFTQADCDFAIVGNENIGWFMQTQSYGTDPSSGIRMAMGAINKEATPMSPGGMENVTDSTNVMRSVILPYTFSITKDMPLYSEYVKRCPNEQIKNFKSRTIFELDGKTYVKLWQDMIFEIDTAAYN